MSAILLLRKWRQILPWSLSRVFINAGSGFEKFLDFARKHEKSRKRQQFYREISRFCQKKIENNHLCPVILTKHWPNSLILVTFDLSRIKSWGIKGGLQLTTAVHQVDREVTSKIQEVQNIKRRSSRQHGSRFQNSKLSSMQVFF